MVSFATITLNIKQHTTTTTTPVSTATAHPSPPDALKNEITHIEITQIVTPGGIVSTESRVLDWTLRDHRDHVFGDVKLKARWVRLRDLKTFKKEEVMDEGYEDGIEVQAQTQAQAQHGNVDGDDEVNVDVVDEFLITGWEHQAEEQDQEQKYVQTWGESERKGWIATQVRHSLISSFLLIPPPYFPPLYFFRGGGGGSAPCLPLSSPPFPSAQFTIYSTHFLHPPYVDLGFRTHKRETILCLSSRVAKRQR